VEKQNSQSKIENPKFIRQSLFVNRKLISVLQSRCGASATAACPAHAGAVERNKKEKSQY